jgi:hypothetical protein
MCTKQNRLTIAQSQLIITVLFTCFLDIFKILLLHAVHTVNEALRLLQNKRCNRRNAKLCGPVTASNLFFVKPIYHCTASVFRSFTKRTRGERTPKGGLTREARSYFTILWVVTYERDFKNHHTIRESAYTWTLLSFGDTELIVVEAFYCIPYWAFTTEISNMVWYCTNASRYRFVNDNREIRIDCLHIP